MTVDDPYREYEQPCPQCGGTGQESAYSIDCACVDCKGTGLKLTEAGESLIRFLRRYLA